MSGVTVIDVAAVGAGLLLAAAILLAPAGPRKSAGPALIGRAAWYGEELRGSPMANGKPFNPDAFTCASWHWPLGTWVRVTHGGVSEIVQVTDRGPSRKYPDRIVDLSRAAFARLADPDVGIIDVTVTPLE